MMGSVCELNRSAKRLYVLAIGLPVIVAISACATAPSTTSATVVASARAAMPPAFSDTAPFRTLLQSSPAPDPLDRWWTRFADPLINRWVDEALEKNSDIAVAQARVLQVRALAERAQADTSPSLQLDTSASRRRAAQDETFAGASRTVSTLTAQGRVTWEIDLFGRLGAASRAAGARAEASQADQAGVRLIVTAEVVRQALTARAGQARLKAAQGAVASAQALAEIAQARADAGLATPADGLRARAQLQEAQADEAALHANVSGTLAALAVLLQGTPIAIADQLAAAPEAKPLNLDLGTVLPGELLRRRPDVRQAEALLRAAGADVDAVNASRWPDLKVDASAGLAGATFSALSGPGAAVGALASALTWTFFDGGSFAADRGRASAAQQEAMALYRQVVHRAFIEADAALAEVTQAKRTARTMAVAVESQSAATAVFEQQYRAGLRDASAWLDAQRAEERLRDRSTQSRLALDTAWVTVYRSLGGDSR